MLCVPRKDIPRDLQNPIKATIDITLCDKHIGEPTVNELLTDNMRELFVAQTAINNSNPPDFDKAYVENVRIDSVRYQDVLRQKRAKGLI